MKTLCLLLPLALSTAPQDDTTDIARAYVEEVMENRDYEAAEILTSEDIFFRDPTSLGMGLGLAEGIHGRDALIEVQKQFKLVRAKMAPKHEFSSGPYHCVLGEFSSWAAGASYPSSFPLLTILKVEDGQIVERTDFGDYGVLNPKNQTPEAIAKELGTPQVQAAKAYVKAYGERDYDAMLALAAEEVVFQDRTAVRIGSGTPVQGRERFSHMLRSVLGNLSSFSIQIDTEYFHGNYAVFAGEVSYAFPGAQVGLSAESFGVTHELAIVLEFKDGKIIRHDDLADYDAYVEALMAAKEAH